MTAYRVVTLTGPGGMLSEEQFTRGSATFRQALMEPGLRAYWLRHRDVMIKAAHRYCAFIDTLCAEGPATVGDWAP